MTKRSESHLTFWEHLEELRAVLIKSLLAVAAGFCLALLFSHEIVQILSLPYTHLSGLSKPPTIVLLSPLEGFSCLMRTCLWMGLVAASPIWFYFLFQFVAPALGALERRKTAFFLLSSYLYMFLGCICAYYFSIPYINRFLMSLNAELGENFWSLTEYLDYTLLLLFAHALLFEACALLFLLIHYRVITSAFLRHYRRVTIVGIFILSALLTPPDVLSQVLLAIPLMAIYELAILYAWVRERKNAS